MILCHLSPPGTVRRRRQPERPAFASSAVNVRHGREADARREVADNGLSASGLLMRNSGHCPFGHFRTLKPRWLPSASGELASV